MNNDLQRNFRDLTQEQAADGEHVLMSAHVVAPIRFERTTFPLGGGRSIQLSYGAIGGDSRTNG